MADHDVKFGNAALLFNEAGEPSSVSVSWVEVFQPTTGRHAGHTLTTTSTSYIPAHVFDAAAKALGYTKRKGKK